MLVRDIVLLPLDCVEKAPSLDDQDWSRGWFMVVFPGARYRISNGAMTSETTDINLIRIFMDGPEVSLNGSPTVSPTTAALWASDPFFSPATSPFSIAFLALSHAPPALAIIRARRTPVTVAPASMPPSAAGPRRNPTNTGATTAEIPGRIISF